MKKNFLYLLSLFVVSSLISCVSLTKNDVDTKKLADLHGVDFKIFPSKIDFIEATVKNNDDALLSFSLTEGVYLLEGTKYDFLTNQPLPVRFETSSIEYLRLLEITNTYNNFQIKFGNEIIPIVPQVSIAPDTNKNIVVILVNTKVSKLATYLINSSAIPVTFLGIKQDSASVTLGETNLSKENVAEIGNFLLRSLPNQPSSNLIDSLNLVYALSKVEKEISKETRLQTNYEVLKKSYLKQIATLRDALLPAKALITSYIPNYLKNANQCKLGDYVFVENVYATSIAKDLITAVSRSYITETKYTDSNAFLLSGNGLSNMKNGKSFLLRYIGTLNSSPNFEIVQLVDSYTIALYRLDCLDPELEKYKEGK